MSEGQAWLHPKGDALARPWGNTYWLWPGFILAGEHPGGTLDNGQTKLHSLQQAGITHFIDLTSSEDPVFAYEAPVGTVCLRHPVKDFGTPSALEMLAVLNSIQTAINDGGKVYVHCRAGIGRTGTVAATWLVSQGMTGQEALALLQLKWQAMAKSALEPHSPETQAQRDFVLAWAKADSTNKHSKQAC